MAAHPCARCDAHKAADIHGRDAIAKGTGHAYEDPRGQAKLSPMSAGRKAYVASQEHKDAYATLEAYPECLMGMAGAPTPCSGPPTPHHILARSAAGSLQRAELFPVITLCAGHNTAVEQDPVVRKWAEQNTFERAGIVWPFRLTLRAARQYWGNA